MRLYEIEYDDRTFCGKSAIKTTPGIGGPALALSTAGDLTHADHLRITARDRIALVPDLVRLFMQLVLQVSEISAGYMMIFMFFMLSSHLKEQRVCSSRLVSVTLFVLDFCPCSFSISLYLPGHLTLC